MKTFLNVSYLFKILNEGSARIYFFETFKQQIEQGMELYKYLIMSHNSPFTNTLKMIVV